MLISSECYHLYVSIGTMCACGLHYTVYMCVCVHTCGFDMHC